MYPDSTCCVRVACCDFGQTSKAECVVLLENVRFHKGETKNDPAFAEQVRGRYLRLATGGTSGKSSVYGGYSEFGGTAYDKSYEFLVAHSVDSCLCLCLAMVVSGLFGVPLHAKVNPKRRQHSTS